MSANQVVLYFDKQEDALLFTLAASSLEDPDGHVQHSKRPDRYGNRSAEEGRIPE